MRYKSQVALTRNRRNYSWRALWTKGAPSSRETSCRCMAERQAPADAGPAVAEPAASSLAPEAPAPKAVEQQPAAASSRQADRATHPWGNALSSTNA